MPDEVLYPDAREFALWLLRTTGCATATEFSDRFGFNATDARSLQRWLEGKHRPSFQKVMRMLRIAGVLDALPESAVPAKSPLERLEDEVRRVGDEVAAIRAALLTDEEREILAMRYSDRLSVAEIADRQGLTQSSVKVKLVAAARKLIEAPRDVYAGSFTAQIEPDLERPRVGQPAQPEPDAPAEQGDRPRAQTRH